MLLRLSSASKRVIVVSALLGLFLLLDIALFGWLIFRTLSKRELDRVLVETRAEAQDIAERLEGRATLSGQDLFTATASEREVQTYIDSILRERKFIRTLEIVDSEGRVVFRGTSEATFELEPDDKLTLETSEAPDRVELRPFESQTSFPLTETVESLHDLSLPIGELGFLNVGISQGELQRSVDVLRADLVRTTATIAGLTTLVFAVAFLIIWRLWNRGQRLEEQARESERLAYIGTLASGLAHEIRNPLNSLNLNMQLLEEEIGGRPGIDSSGRLLGITREEIQRLERLVTEFLQYAKPPPLDLQVVSIADLAARCVQVLGSELESLGARLRIDDRSHGAEVRVDRGQMNQLLMNLVQNALAAQEEAGRQLEVRLRLAHVDGLAMIDVEDSGSGMSEEQIDHMFDLFYSTRKGGTGLGLAVVQRIARAHGARIEVESSPGVGTRVRVALPSMVKDQDVGRGEGGVSSGETAAE